MIYELRVYHCTPGKVQALSKRFETVTWRLFEKHGFQQVGFWTVSVGQSSDFVYMLKWESHSHRDRSFAAFQSDPEWIEARAKTEQDGPLVASVTNTILLPTSYSAAK